MCRLTVASSDADVSALFTPPLVVWGEVRNLSADLPGEAVVLRGWPNSDTAAVRFLGDCRVRAERIELGVKRVYVGDPGAPAVCHLEGLPVNDQGTTPVPTPDSRLTVGGGFAGRLAWARYATQAPPAPPGDRLGQLLDQCARRLPDGLGPVTAADYSLGDAANLRWAARYGDLLPRLLQGLVGAGLATVTNVDARGDAKVRVRLAVPWSALAVADTNPDRDGAGHSAAVGRLLAELRR